MLPAAAATLLPYVGGFAGSFITRKNIPNWYEHLVKPSWRPPNWAFGPVWTCLYGGMGFASYLVWRDGGDATALSLYSAQLALNWAWTPIFFGAHRVRAAFLEMCVLWAAAGATGLAFHQVNRAAGLLFLPYMAWLSLAAALNYAVWRDNGATPEVARE